MNSSLSLRHAVVVGTIGVLLGAFAATAQAADTAAGKTPIPVAVAPNNAHAAGAVEDSLQACLARIPKDATAGQRMIAEQSCRRDEGDRKPFQASGSR